MKKTSKPRKNAKPKKSTNTNTNTNIIKINIGKNQGASKRKRVSKSQPSQIQPSSSITRNFVFPVRQDYTPLIDDFSRPNLLNLFSHQNQINQNLITQGLQETRQLLEHGVNNQIQNQGRQLLEHQGNINRLLNVARAAEPLLIKMNPSYTQETAEEQPAEEQPAENVVEEQPKTPKPKTRGRPKGSKNKIIKTTKLINTQQQEDITNQN